MKNTISVEFTGICTHILSGLGEEHPRHRIVLVRADHGANILTRRIPPHIPKLHIKKKDISGFQGGLDGLRLLEPEPDTDTWQIVGARLELEGVMPERFSPEPSYDTDVPPLRSRGGKLDPAAHDVVVQERAAGYFDIRGGSIKATKTKHLAVSTELTARISGEPSLKVTCFWNREASSILLHPGAKIRVEHTGTLLGDTKYDFLLHYLIFPSIPDDVEYPEEPKWSMERDPGDISAGCSNSRYP